MIEFRWVVFGPNKQLEYRMLSMGIDASGALSPGKEWGDWRVVPTIDGNDAAYQDLAASGGIVDAP